LCAPGLCWSTRPVCRRLTHRVLQQILPDIDQPVLLAYRHSQAVLQHLHVAHEALIHHRNHVAHLGTGGRNIPTHTVYVPPGISTYKVRAHGDGDAFVPITAHHTCLEGWFQAAANICETALISGSSALAGKGSGSGRYDMDPSG